MKIVVAPDSFKESLSAPEAAAAISEGIRRVFRDAEIEEIPLADGGEGTAQTLVEATGGSTRSAIVTGPLGEKVVAQYGLLGDGNTAVVEMAAASGLALVPLTQRNPMRTTSYGTGELVAVALDQGVQEVVIGVGGSATVDGGVGMVEALGVKPLDENGGRVARGGSNLSRIASFDTSGLNPRVGTCKITVACDVNNPLCGDNGAARVYGPQKGATQATAEALDAALAHLSEVIEKQTGIVVKDMPGTGAAGGIGASVVAFLGGTLCSGAEVVLRAVEFEKRVADADLIVTGEGRLDGQTASGKPPAAVAKIGKQLGIPVVAVAGTLGTGYESLFEMGLNAATAGALGPVDEQEAMSNAGELITAAAERAMRFVKTGTLLGRQDTV
jgi:glycerate kinase